MAAVVFFQYISLDLCYWCIEVMYPMRGFWKVKREKDVWSPHSGLNLQENKMKFLEYSGNVFSSFNYIFASFSWFVFRKCVKPVKWCRPLESPIRGIITFSAIAGVGEVAALFLLKI